MSPDEIRGRTQGVWDRYYRLPEIWKRAHCVKALKSQLAFVLISKLYRQMYANTESRPIVRAGKPRIAGSEGSRRCAGDSSRPSPCRNCKLQESRKRPSRFCASNANRKWPGCRSSALAGLVVQTFLGHHVRVSVGFRRVSVVSSDGCIATDIAEYTGQCSSMMASDRLESTSFFFRSKWSVPSRRSLVEQHWRHPAHALHSDILHATKEYRRAAEPHSLHNRRASRYWLVYT